jgi:tetratricopeptide (TPR) repeat protein
VLSSAQQAVDALQGKTADDTNPLLRTYSSALPDIKKAASLSQTNYRAWAWSAFVEFVQHNQSDSSPKDIDDLPQSSQDYIRQAMARLQSMADHPNPRIAAGALDGLTSVQLISGSAQAGEAIENLSRAVKLDPGRNQAWDFLIGLLGSEEGRTQELVETCRARVTYRDSIRNRLFLIKALDRAGRVDEALEVADAVIDRHPGDVAIHACAAALLMHKDTSEETLGQAARHLARAEAGLKQLNLANDLRTLPLDLALSKAVWLALSGQVEPAKKFVDQVLKLAPEHPRAAEIQAQLKYWQ